MADRLWILSALILLTSFILQLVAAVSPGWFVTQYTMYGIFYQISCSTESDCKTYSVPELWEHSNDYSKKDILRYNFAYDVLHLLLPLSFCAATMCVVICGKQNRPPSKMISAIVLLTIAAVLQWELTAGYSNLNRRVSVHADSDHDVYRFPWSLFLYGIASAGTTAVTMIHIISLVRHTKDPLSQSPETGLGMQMMGYQGQIVQPPQYEGQSYIGPYQGQIQTGIYQAPNQMSPPPYQGPTAPDKIELYC